MKIIICVPTDKALSDEFVSSINNQNYAEKELLVISRAPEGDYAGQKKVSYNSTLNRRFLRQQCLKSDANHFLFVDSDVILPSNALTSFASQKQFHILGGWYPMVDAPYWVAANEVEEKQFVLFDKPQESVVRADMVGLGCVFLSRKALESIEFEDGIGEIVSVAGNKCYLGPCGKFGQDAKKKGFRLFMNGDVICSHVPKTV